MIKSVYRNDSSKPSLLLCSKPSVIVIVLDAHFEALEISHTILIVIRVHYVDEAWSLY